MSSKSDRENARSEPDAFRIREFCERHGFSLAHYYRLREDGLGPVEMRAGNRVLISKESAQRWRRQLEAESKREAKRAR